MEKLRVLVLEADRLLALGLLVISNLLTAEIFDWPLVLAGDCGALLGPGLALKLGLLVFPVGEDTDPARVRLRPVRGMVLSPFTPPPPPPPPPLRLPPPLQREAVVVVGTTVGAVDPTQRVGSVCELFQLGAEKSTAVYAGASLSDDTCRAIICQAAQ